MTLPKVPVPKLTALFSLALVVERIAELKPLAAAIYDNNRFIVVMLARSLANLTGSTIHDIQSSLAATDAAPEIFASKEAHELSISILLQHYSNSKTEYEIINKTVRRLMSYHAASTKPLKMLNNLQALAASESFEAIIMHEDHTRLNSLLCVYLTALQTLLRWIGIQVVPRRALSKQAMKRGCSDTEFFNELERSLQSKKRG